MDYNRVIPPSSGILRPQVGRGRMRGLRHVRRHIAVKVCKLLIAMIVVSGCLAGGMITAWHITELIRRRSSGLRSTGIRMRTMHHWALGLRMLRLRTVKVLVVAVLWVLLCFIMGLVVASTLLHGATRCLLVLHLGVIPAHMHLLALVPRH